MPWFVRHAGRLCEGADQGVWHSSDFGGDAAQVPGGEANDPMAFSIAAILLFLTALIACYGPVRRVARLDAIEVLRHE